jgi:hypothetical protein
LEEKSTPKSRVILIAQSAHRVLWRAVRYSPYVRCDLVVQSLYVHVRIYVRQARGSGASSVFMHTVRGRD